MKRAKDLYQKLISDENLRLAILTVNATHKWHPHHRPNKTVLRVEADIDGYVEKLREIIVNGYDAAPPRIARRWDKSAGKWRDISEPRLWPDQYVHHAVIQVLEPVLMRGMDKFCCGSIKGRGIHSVYGWVDEDDIAATASADTALAVGDRVKMDKSATIYGTMRKFAAWVYAAKLYVRGIDGNRVVVSTLKSGAITGAVDKKHLTKV